MFTYYDYHRNRTRIKRRYAWAGFAFVAGTYFGVFLSHHLHLLAIS